MRALSVRTKPFFAAASIAVFFTALFFAVAAFSINPGVGEGAELDPASFRYRAGEFLDHRVVPILAIPFWPGVILREVMHIRSGAWDLLFMPVPLCMLLWLSFTYVRYAVPSRERVRTQL
jgi:hypothetical protein